MGTILLLLFIFFIVIPLVRIGIRVWTLQRQWRRAQQQMADAFAGAGRDASSAAGGAGRQERRGPQRPPRRKKKIDPSVGEYVFFEEIHTETTTDSTSGTAGVGKTKFRAESQVEDAVWEEIK